MSFWGELIQAQIRAPVLARFFLGPRFRILRHIHNPATKFLFWSRCGGCHIQQYLSPLSQTPISDPYLEEANPCTEPSRLCLPQGEFETGFERGGQTREHAQLAKVLGVSKLIVVVNKMDDPSITEADGTWSKTRFGEIEAKLIPFLKSCGYNPKRDLIFLPISGLLGHNIKEPAPAGKCPWYKGGTLFEVGPP